MYNLYRITIIFILLFLVCDNVIGQEYSSWKQYFYEVAANEDGETLDDDAYEWLCQMATQPLDINNATREELEQLPFLTARQIEDICEYRYQHGPLVTLDELIAIPSIDYSRRLLLTYFIYIGEKREESSIWKSLWNHPHQQFVGNLRVPLYTRQGDKNGYLGYKYRHSLRYDFATQHLKMGFAAMQDAGEPFFAYKNTMGYDSYAYFVQLKQMGMLQSGIIGHFNAQFGMGLTLNTGFSLGKTALLSNLVRSTNGFRPSLSRNANNSFQGLATTLKLNHDFSLSSFVSYRPHDATLDKTNGTVTTIVNTGYHRTESEMNRKNNLYSTSTGLNLHYFKHGLNLGLTAIYTHFSRQLSPDTKTLYRRYYPKGNDFVNMGIDYGYNSKRFQVHGETAIDKQGAVATINSLSITIPYKLNAVVLHRYYSPRYTSLFTHSLSDGGQVKNENGIYIGAEYIPISNLKLISYIDFVHFPWARYRVSRPSDAFDALLSATLQLKSWVLLGRYRLHTRYWDNKSKTAIIRQTTHRGRLSMSYHGKQWDYSAQADIAIADYRQHDIGYMLSQRFSYKCTSWLLLQGGLNYFHTDSYESRLYAYEPTPSYSLGISAFSGHGIRGILQIKVTINSNVSLLVKTGTTYYFDRSKIGTALQEVNKSSMTDIDFQLKWRF